MTERELHLVVSSLRQRAVTEARLHYDGNPDAGIAGELNRLAAKLAGEAELTDEDLLS